MPLTVDQKTQLASLAQALIDRLNAIAGIVVPPPAQTIDLFTASATTINLGASVTLNWATSNATAVRLNGTSVPASGSQAVSPTVFTQYTLEADGSAATLSKQISVTVTQPNPNPQPDTTGNPILAAMKPGELKYLAPFSFAVAAGAPAGNGDAWHTTDQTTFTYDDKRYGIWHMGGGHAGTANDGLHFFDIATLAWQNVYLPTPYADRKFENYDCVNGGWNDPKLTNPASTASGSYPRPSARHVEQLLPLVGDQLVLMKSVDGNGTSGGDCVGPWWWLQPVNGVNTWTFGLVQSGGGYVTSFACEHVKTKGSIWHYDILTKTWTPSQALAFPSYTESNGGTGWTAGVYDEQSKLCWIVGRDGLWTYDPINRTPRVKVKTWSIAQMGVAMALVYYPPTDTYYWCAHFVGTPAVIRYYAINFNRANPAATPNPVLVSPTGTYRGQDSVGGSTTEMAFDYDPFTKKIWAGPFVNSGVISFTWFDPATNTVGNVSPTNTSDAGFTPNRCVFHNARIDRKTGVWIWIDNNTGRTWAWKPPQ